MQNRMSVLIRGVFLENKTRQFQECGITCEKGKGIVLVSEKVLGTIEIYKNLQSYKYIKKLKVFRCQWYRTEVLKWTIILLLVVIVAYMWVHYVASKWAVNKLRRE